MNWAALRASIFPTLLTSKCPQAFSKYLFRYLESLEPLSPLWVARASLARALAPPFESQFPEA